LIERDQRRKLRKRLSKLWLRQPLIATGKRALSEERVERRLAAILAGDIAGYSRLMGADEEGMLDRIKKLRRRVGRSQN
jgi:class 3 adenylate cyclase